MLWFKKQVNANDAGREIIRPGELGVEFDSATFNGKFEQMLLAMNDKGGVERFVESLANKHRLFHQALAPEFITALDQETVNALLETTFTARRRLPEALIDIDHKVVVAAIQHLLYGKQPLYERMTAFQALVPDDKPKGRRAAWDFGAELLHFNAPEHYPLMVRWVWDRNTLSGAMREFIRGNDSLSDIPIPAEPEAFEAGRFWLAEQLNARGFYRDLHFTIDLVMAHAYAEYMIAISSGMGMLGSDFGPKNEPLELIVKLLGIDPDRRGGKSRLKQPVFH